MLSMILPSNKARNLHFQRPHSFYIPTFGVASQHFCKFPAGANLRYTHGNKITGKSFSYTETIYVSLPIGIPRVSLLYCFVAYPLVN